MPSIVKRLHRRSSSSRSSGFSSSSDEESSTSDKQELDPPVLVYHSSARSIVFRDQLRRAATRSRSTVSDATDSRGASLHSTGGISSPPTSPKTPSKAVAAADDDDVPFPPGSPRSSLRSSSTTHHVVTDDSEHKHVDKFGTVLNIAHEIVNEPEETVALIKEAGVSPQQIAGYMPKLEPLPPLELGPNDEYARLLEEQPVEDMSINEQEAVQLLRDQRACVKTIKNTDWTAFLQRFIYSQLSHPRSIHHDIAPLGDHRFNSFVTSTSLLPSEGKKMRCFGSTSQYTVGCVFALPKFASDEEEAAEAEATNTWSWPAGYSAKTEFNRDSQGRLINGRQEALTPLSVLRQYNQEYLTSQEYTVAFRKVSGLQQIPYNEVFLRVGGIGRLVNGKDVATGEPSERTFTEGVGLPIALFVRSASYGNLMSLLRTRARMINMWGERHVKGIPLLLISPEIGTRVLTDKLQKELWKIASNKLNPFQNSAIAHRTTMKNTDEESFQQKVEELFDLDESIREILTPEELAHLAGGFGATDESVAAILKQVMMRDHQINKEKKKSSAAGVENIDESHKLQDVVNEGLASALRSGDYHTARQLLILYSLVATRTPDDDDEDDTDLDGSSSSRHDEDSMGEHKSEHHRPEMNKQKEKRHLIRKASSSMGRNVEALKEEVESLSKGKPGILTAPPPPPPLDTDRLRRATNSDGLLAVLGAAQVLRAMQDGSAKIRTVEAISAIEEWVNYGEQSMAFRISSWYDQRAAQDDLKIATENNSSFMAFVSNKAIANRKAFAQQLREVVSATDFTDVRFLVAINEMLSRMHSPCLRLELLQYVLGLDNRYSVAHVERSIELAATCLGMSTAR